MGYGVSACATCDGFFFRDKEIVVVGGGDTAMEEATYLTKFASKVTVIHRRARAARLQDHAGARLRQPEDRLDLGHRGHRDRGHPRGRRDGGEAAQQRDRRSRACYPTQGVFFAIGHEPNTELFRGQLEMDDVGYIKVQEPTTKTNVPGRLRRGRRDGPDLPPGGHRRRHRLPRRDRRRALARGASRLTRARCPAPRPRSRPSAPCASPATGRAPSSRRSATTCALRLKDGGPLFPGILGYDRTVIPAVVNALLAGHDFILLGLRGQAKTRILRALTDPARPRGARCSPAASSTTIRWRRSRPAAQRIVAELGDDAPVDWLPREQRYNEKLATPDVSIADLLGDIDPIKAATRKLTFADPEVIHFGIIPRTNRGIFAINELPDLAPRIQVGLFNILEERDLQIRGFPVRIPLDLLMVFSANPEDYTNRGSIITPLKDRISSQILTHYPPDARRRGRHHPPGGVDRARAVAAGRDPRRRPRCWSRRSASPPASSDLVDQSSGVSARVAIAALELLASNLERRALRDRRRARLSAPLRPATCCCRRSPARSRWSTRASSRAPRWSPGG